MEYDHRAADHLSNGVEESFPDLAEVREKLNRLLDTYVAEGSLQDRDRTVLQLRLGLLDGTHATLDEVGARIGVTKERVRQRQNRAVYRLRRFPNFGDLLAAYRCLSPPPRARHRTSPWLKSSSVPVSPESRERSDCALLADFEEKE